MRSARRIRQRMQPLAVRLGLWALIIQILLPLGQGIDLPNALLPSGLDGGQRTLVICSANGGLRTISLPPEAGQRAGKDAPSAPQDTVQRDCPICLSYAAGQHLALPLAVATWGTGRSTRSQPRPAVTVLAIGFWRDIPPARAPPQSFFS